MASFDVNMPDDFLEKYNFTEEEIVETVSELSPILEDSMKRNLRSVISHTGDSSLVDSVKISKPKKTKTDAILSWVGPAGKDKSGTRNVEKAIYLNYGTRHQPARPWLAKAINDAEELIQDRIQEKLEKRYE